MNSIVIRKNTLKTALLTTRSGKANRYDGADTKKCIAHTINQLSCRVEIKNYIIASMEVLENSAAYQSENQTLKYQ